MECIGVDIARSGDTDTCFRCAGVRMYPQDLLLIRFGKLNDPMAIDHTFYTSCARDHGPIQIVGPQNRIAPCVSEIPRIRELANAIGIVGPNISSREWRKAEADIMSKHLA